MILEARNLNKFYSSGKTQIQVLKDIDLLVATGETVAIVGPSGAGKSTLLHILGGLDSPSAGEVWFEGRSLQKFPEKELAKVRGSLIGFVFQFYHLLPEFNALENVMLAALISLRGHVKGLKQKASELLASVGLEKRARHFPNQLSGGEQQRVAIARALINEPKLLLCDEPTGNLDSESGRQICSLLKSLNEDKAMTIITVTHNLDVAGLARKVYNIQDGVLCLSGGSQAQRTHSGLMR